MKELYLAVVQHVRFGHNGHPKPLATRERCWPLRWHCRIPEASSRSGEMYAMISR